MSSGGSKPTLCPSCGGPRVAAILYGLPMFDDELNRSLDEGRVVLGGCSVFEDSATWRCLECGHQWGVVDLPESRGIDS
jgi:hypothetical protein